MSKSTAKNRRPAKKVATKKVDRLGLLLKLAKLLRQDAENKKGIQFNMATFGEVKNPAQPVSCGTSACALGLAALSGQFERYGLRYRIGVYAGNEAAAQANDPDQPLRVLIFDTDQLKAYRKEVKDWEQQSELYRGPRPVFDDDPYEAAAKVFGITEEESMELFGWDSLKGERGELVKAEEIEQFVRDKRKERRQARR